MALKDNWIDRQNGVDDVDSEDINKVARAVIEVEKQLDDVGIGATFVQQTTGQSTKAVMSQKATTYEINAIKSDIAELQTALIGVSELIGGDA